MGRSGAAVTPLSIAFATRSVPINGRTPWDRDLGGSESALVFAARALAARGHEVDVFTLCDAPGLYDEVTWRDLAELDGHARARDWDVFVSLRFPDLVQKDVRAALRVLWCQDVVSGLDVPSWLAWCDLLVFVSEWHRKDTVAAWPAIELATAVVANGIDLATVPPPPARGTAAARGASLPAGARPSSADRGVAVHPRAAA